MSAWTCSLGWFRFTVSDSTADEVIARVGGEWIKDKKGFLGYRQGWLSRGHAGGLGRIGTGASWAPREVHVDLSQELISDWTYQKFHDVATWVFERKGHFGRIDVALDDRNGVIDVDRIYASVKAGNCVSHFRQSRLISGLDVGSGSDTGKTLCMGSRQSDTYLRIYDKAAEQRAKEKPIEGTWIRWEMEWKSERADAEGMALSGLDQDQFQKYIVGVFRSALDFRDCTRADDPKDRYYAPLLDWWKVLTEGMQRARLEIAKSVQKIEDVKRWAEKSLSPMLGLLCAHPEAGEKWLVSIIVEGVERMGRQTFGVAGKWPGSKTAPEKDAGMGSQTRILCRLCRTGELRLYMCGPRLRGRCEACGTVFVFLWSCLRQGWVQWSNERGKHV